MKSGSKNKVAVAHDYLATSGGAERVVSSLVRAFPGAPVYTSIYESKNLFPDLNSLLTDVRTSPLNKVAFFRNHYRAAMPLLAATMRRFHVDADVVICSSSGWSHGVQTSGRKVVYCHNPARWLYQTEEYTDGRRRISAAAKVMRPYLLRFDHEAAHSCTRYLANSGVVAQRIAQVYGIEAEVLPPPTTLSPSEPRQAVEGLPEGFVLCVSRLLPYKNVRSVVEAMRLLPHHKLVVAGGGPLLDELRLSAPANVRILGRVTDDELRWLYANSQGLIAAGFEDFGLTPIEAGLFGKPTACLRYGGFLDTMVEGETGLFFDEPTAPAIAATVGEMLSNRWGNESIALHASRFGEAGFRNRLQQIVHEELLFSSLPSRVPSGLGTPTQRPEYASSASPS
jgi:glycosyltransferase involved in cell wall biosynthesis